MTLIRMGDALKRALQQVTENMTLRKSGLLVPDYIAGKHFGGFGGYEPWVQDCIRVSCQAARGLPPDEISELTSLVMWESSEHVDFFIDRHASTLRALERYAESVTDLLRQHGEHADAALRLKAVEQVRRANGTRELGTLLVIATCWVIEEKPEGSIRELKLSVSAWNPASIEEARAVPKQAYTLG